MSHHRTGGMTAIGILNIVFGALGTLAFTLMVVGGGLLATFGATAGPASGTASGTEGAGMLAVGGGILMLIGIVGLAVNVMLLASGIGVLKVAPWGRTLSIVCGVLGILAYGASMATSEFSFATLISLGYCVLLTGMCFTPGWRAAFSGSPGEAMDHEEHHGQGRRAA